jgi:hypothetical protein
VYPSDNGEEGMRKPPMTGWVFETEEVSAGIYRVRGTSQQGHKVETTSHDPDKAFEWCQRAARELTARGLSKA